MNNIPSQPSGQSQPGEAYVRKTINLENRMKSGANWFFWIAGLSVINSILWLSGTEISFIVGLGITQFIDGFAWGISQESGNTILQYIAFGINLSIAGLFFMFGYMAKRKYGWAFGIGLALYAIDTFIYILLTDFIGIAFHVFALYSIYGGYKALREITETPAQPMPAVHETQKELSGVS